MDMLDFIRKEGLDTEGLFRKAGNAARVMVLEETIDHNPSTYVCTCVYFICIGTNIQFSYIRIYMHSYVRTYSVHKDHSRD